ncbi:MAG: fatty acid desaturase [Steroidobacteraceae bacterium]|nr:fatty acid desaturase [Steroidobacteraceae bacterium]
MNLDFLYGLLQLSFWGYVLAGFLLVQVTMMAVTLYLHRDAAHRAVDLHPALRHFFRFWIWFTSGMVTREWVAVHRKHHAFSDVAGDPHSPVLYGLKRIVLEGAEVYRDSARDPAVCEKYGRGTPDDWLERNVYAKHRNLGITSMIVTWLLLFGVPGIILIAVQLIAMPLMAAGVINGLGHATGYRNYECDNAARNLVPWGLLVGGEELHNNHHAFPSSARFSMRRWEFDIGWMWLKVFSALGLAQVRRVAPRPVTDAPRDKVDLETVTTIITARMQVLRDYAATVTIPTLKAEAARSAGAVSRRVKKLLVRHPSLLDDAARERLQQVLAESAALRTVHEFRERLAVLWSGKIGNNERLTEHLREWICEAEASGVERLQVFARQLRSYRLEPMPA